ncbi:hypothetical protein HDU67_005775 [Dinochytrium kinnereticum]|nr:hypothetical protein HDU67_005775 [Dinochytrium kinnereticum]
MSRTSQPALSRLALLALVALVPLVAASGDFLFPQPDNFLSIGTTANLRWRPVRHGTPLANLTIISAGGDTPVLIASGIDASLGAFNWTIPDGFLQDLYSLTISNGRWSVSSSVIPVQGMTLAFFFPEVMVDGTSSLAASDPCTAMNAFGTVGPYSTSLACMDTVPFDADLARSTLDTIRKSILQTYAFVDISKKTSNEEGSTKVNVEHSLNRIELRFSEYKNDRAFHDALYDLFTELHDGHTQYTSYCHQNGINWYQPFVLNSIVVDGTQRIFVDSTAFEAGEAGDAFFKRYGFDPASYLGWEVLNLDGQAALDHLKDFSERSGIARDGGVRFNLALGRYDYLYMRFQLFYGGWTVRNRAPKRFAVDYLLKSPDGATTRTVRAPFGFANFVFGGFSDSASFASNICRLQSASAFAGPKIIEEAREKSLPELITPTPRVHGVHYREAKIESDGEGFAPMSLLPPPTLLFNNSYVAFWVDGDTGIFKFSQINGGVKTLRDINSNLDKFESLGVKKLILDLGENLGGDVCVSYAFLKYLFPATFRPFAGDFKSSPLLDVMASAASSKNISQTIYHYKTYWTDSQGDKPINSDWLIKNLTAFKRGGGNSAKYTATRAIDCRTGGDGTRNYYEVMRKRDVGPWKASDMAIVSNGHCGSSCAIIQRYLQNVEGVKSFAVGGLLNSKLSASQTIGGLVTNLDAYDPAGDYSGTFALDLNDLGVQSDSAAPQPFVVPAYLSWTLFEIYGKEGRIDKDTLPMEFVPSFAEERLHPTSMAQVRDPHWKWRHISGKL